MSDGGELATIRAFANKAGEHVVRVAGVRTIYADADAAEIADAAVVGAIDLVQHYLGEAMRLRGMAGEGAHLRRAQDLPSRASADPSCTWPKSTSTDPPRRATRPRRARRCVSLSITGTSRPSRAARRWAAGAAARHGRS